ncbi:MAG: ATP cone domain-containing protein, partial [Promethearchaeota archaeon]
MMEFTDGQEEKLYVVNRKGNREDVYYDRMTEHIKMLCTMDPPLAEVDAALLARKAIDQMIPGITTSQIDNLLAEDAACMARTSDDYIVLAGRIAIHNLHKDIVALYDAWEEGKSSDPTMTVTENLNYVMVVCRLYSNNYSGSHSPLIS